MSNVKDGDIFMVSRDGTEFQVKNEDTSNLRDDDLFWVQRDGVNYSVTADQVNTGGDFAPPVLSSVQLQRTTTGDRFTDQQFLTSPSYTATGSPPPTIGLKGEVTGALSIAGATDEIVGIIQQTLTVTSNGASGWGEGGSYTNSILTGISGVAPDTGKSLYSQIKEDGDLMDTRFIMNYNDQANGYINIVYNPPIVTDSLDVYSGIYSASSSDTGTITVTFDDGSTSVKNVTGGTDYNMDRHIFPTGGKAVVSIRCDGYYSNYGGASTGGRDGLVFNSDNTILTLASDVNLTNGAFKAGDVVKQDNSPLVPTSSAITNVEDSSKEYVDPNANYADPDGTVPGDPITIYDAVPVNAGFDNSAVSLPAVLFDGTDSNLYMVTANNTVTEFKISLDAVGAKPGDLWGTSNHCPGDAPSYQPWGLQFCDASKQPFGAITTLGTINGAVMQWTEVLIPDNAKYVLYKGFALATSYCQSRIAGFRINGRTVVSGDQVTLTLTNSDGLEDFEVGDVVQTDVSITAIDENVPSITTDGGSWSGTDGSGEALYDQNNWSSLTTANGTTPNPPINLAFDGDVTNGCQVSGDGSAGFTLVIPSGYSNVKLETSCAFGGAYPVNTLVNGEQRGVNDDSFIDCGTVSSGNTVQIVRTFPGGGATTLYGIKLNNQLLVDTGVTGGPESFVTGPQTDITATLVSVDPSVPSMEVTDIVGPWSANTGNYVVNTVVNPVMIKPETSPIAEVGSSSSATALMYGMDRGISNLADVLANGTLLEGGEAMPAYLVVVHQGSAKAGETVWQTNGSGAFSIPDPAGGHFDADGNRLGGDGNYNETEWTTFLYQNTNKDSYTVSLVAAYTVFILKTAGTIPAITEGDLTTLTLTDDTDLNQFAAGDDVYAGGEPPVTFAPVLYSGTGGTQSITGLGFSPDFVWIKNRNGTENNILFDTLRGPAQYYYSNETNQSNDGGSNTLTSFDADGFTVNDPGGWAVNGSGKTYVAWCWSAGGTTVTNNDGAVTTQVRSNGTFSIAEFDNPSAPATGFFSWGHGLDMAPGLIIWRPTDITNEWYVYHTSTGGGMTYLTSNAATIYRTGNSDLATGNYFEVVNSSIVQADQLWLGATSTKIIAYHWAESPTQSFGSYTGTGVSGTGAEVNCGFEPAFVMIKDSSNTGNWVIIDNARTTSNPRSFYLSANTNLAEDNLGSDPGIQFTSTGFTVSASNANVNKSGDTFIYAAFANGGGGPTGVIGDITGLDMTLSESTGTWEVGQTVTTDEKPALSSTVSLNFDANGTVSGLAIGTPDYVNMNSSTPFLSFTSTFSDGKTPDETIPEGSYIQTEVRAWNELGESTMKSNKITPEDTTRLSKGETRLIDGYTPVATAAARQTIAEAQKIEDKITRATDNLQLAISKYEEQGKRRSV